MKEKKMVNRTKKITIETHSITIIRTRSTTVVVHCEHCGENVTSFTPEQIAAALRVDLTEVSRRLEAQEIHLTSVKDSVALVCINSLGGTQTKHLSK